MRTAVQLTLGAIAFAGLMVAAVFLWVHNWIIFAAPVAFLAVGAVWVAIDNTVIYPKQRARAAGAEPGDELNAPR